MLACRRVNSTVLTVLAWADKATVFGVTDNPNCGNTGQPGCSGKVDQVMFNVVTSYYIENSLLLKRILKLLAAKAIRTSALCADGELHTRPLQVTQTGQFHTLEPWVLIHNFHSNYGFVLPTLDL